VDPFVEISLHIPDWSHSPFLPESATAAGAKYSPSTDATTTSVSSARTVSVRTEVIKNNGFNPVWQEELCLPFDCVGDMMDLIFVEFAVRQEGKDDGEPLGFYCVPLGCLEQGEWGIFSEAWQCSSVFILARFPTPSTSRRSINPTFVLDLVCQD
jgi:phosphatidylinositol phospholipase C delta